MVLGVHNFVVMSFWQFLAILAIKMAEFLNLEHILRQFLKTRSMTDLHILSDPVTDFWKCPKKGLKKLFVWHFFFI